MEITPINKDAFAIMAMCEKTKKTFAITVNPVGRRLNFIWPFPIDKEKAHKEHFDEKNASGQIFYDKNFPGCPYCKTKDFYFCTSCGYMICWHGSKHIICPNCGLSSEIEYFENFNLKGGRI